MAINERLAAAGLPALPRPIWLEIDLDALRNNLDVVSQLAGAGAQVNAVVKSDAYGHGIEACARTLAQAGAARLCVAGIDEALLLRAAGVNAPLLVLYQVPPSRAPEAVAGGIELTASDVDATLATLAGHDPARGELLIHLEVDTGLIRAGVPPDRVAGLARRIVDTAGVRLAALWTHFASYDNAAATAAQVAAFERASAALRANGLPVPPRHAAASGVLFGSAVPAYEGVRPGLALYGVRPERVPLAGLGREAVLRLQPVMTLKARPLRIEQLDAGIAVGYGGTWVTPRRSRIATLPVGYGDGYYRSSSPGAEVLVRGRRVPVVGTIAMDALMVDVTDVPGVTWSDEFVLLGRQGADEISAEELARHRRTISWEVVTAMSQRVTRVYHAGSAIVGVRTLAGESWNGAQLRS